MNYVVTINNAGERGVMAMVAATDVTVKDQVVVRVPREIKNRAEAACKAMGLPMSSAITGFLRFIGDTE